MTRDQQPEGSADAAISDVPLDTALQTALTELKAGAAPSSILESFPLVPVESVGDLFARAFHSDAMLNLRTAANAAQLVADVAKDEYTRSVLGATSLIGGLCSTLTTIAGKVATKDRDTTESVACAIQILRAVGNLCFDHDLNRQRVMDAGFFHAALGCLDAEADANNEKLARTACGAMFNVTANNEQAQNALIAEEKFGVIATAITRVDLTAEDADVTTLNFALRLLNTLTTNESATEKLSMCPKIGHQLYRIMITSADTNDDDDEEEEEDSRDILECTAEVLNAIVEKNANAQVSMANHDCMEGLLAIMETSAVGITHEVNAEQWRRIQGLVLGIIIAVTQNDTNMDVLFNSPTFISRLRGWLEKEASDSPAPDNELAACAALCLGNLARTETNCVKLVQDLNLADPVLAILRKYAPNGEHDGPTISGTESTDGTEEARNNASAAAHRANKYAKMRHGCIGVLKNLAIPIDNKAILSEMDVIEASAPFVGSSIQPLVVATLVLLKHLCNQNVSNARRLLDRNKTDFSMKMLLDVVAKSDDPAVKGEGTRLIINLLTSVFSLSADDDPLRTALMTEDIIAPVVRLTAETRYPVLQIEGVNALRVLFFGKKDGARLTADQLARASAVFTRLLPLTVRLLEHRPYASHVAIAERACQIEKGEWSQAGVDRDCAVQDLERDCLVLDAAMGSKQ